MCSVLGLAPALYLYTLYPPLCIPLWTRRTQLPRFTEILLEMRPWGEGRCSCMLQQSSIHWQRGQPAVSTVMTRGSYTPSGHMPRCGYTDGWMDGWMDVPTLILAECSKTRTRERNFASDGGSSRVDEYQTLPRPTPRVPDQLPPNTTSESIPSFLFFFILIHCSYPTSFLIMRSLD